MSCTYQFLLKITYGRVTIRSAHQRMFARTAHMSLQVRSLSFGFPFLFQLFLICFHCYFIKKIILYPSLYFVFSLVLFYFPCLFSCILVIFSFFLGFLCTLHSTLYYSCFIVDLYWFPFFSFYTCLLPQYTMYIFSAHVGYFLIHVGKLSNT